MSAEFVDPEVAPLLADFPFGPITADTLARFRDMPRVTPELSDKVTRSDHPLETDGTYVRVHEPVKSAEGLRACVFSIHGGGYVLGNVEGDDPAMDRWCQAFDIVGVSVEYRLAPETAYPGPLEDCYAGLRWTFEHADELGIDRNRIGIHGVSAGGGLCAALALLTRDRGEFDLAFQLLDCPMLDDRQATPSSQADKLAIWSRESNTFGWQSYLGDLSGQDDIPYTAVPARAADLAGLPPAYVCVGGADGFRDEDIDYARRLYAAGVPCELHVYPGAPHGVEIFATTAIAQRYGRDRDDWLRRMTASQTN